MIRSFLKMILIAVLCLFIKIVPTHAAIQLENSDFKMDSAVNTIPIEERDSYLIHAPPKIVLSVENDLTVETFYPEEISDIHSKVKENNLTTKYVEHNNYSEEVLIERVESLPRITLTMEDDLLVETFYPSADESDIFDKKVITPQNLQNYEYTPVIISVMALNLDGSNDVQFFESDEPYLQSLNFVVGKSTFSDGYIFRADFMTFL